MKSASLSLVVFFLSRIVGAFENAGELFPHIYFVKICEQLTGVFGAGICFFYLANVSLYSTNKLLIPEKSYSILLVILSSIYVAIDLLVFGISCYKKHYTNKCVRRFVNGRSRQ